MYLHDKQHTNKVEKTKTSHQKGMIFILKTKTSSCLDEDLYEIRKIVDGNITDMKKTLYNVTSKRINTVWKCIEALIEDNVYSKEKSIYKIPFTCLKQIIDNCVKFVNENKI